MDVLLGAVIPALVEGYWVLFRGRTLGEAAVQLQPVPVRIPQPWARLLKFCFGVGGYLAITNVAIPVPLVGFVFVAASAVLLIPTKAHRGLSHLVAGMELRLEDDTSSGDPAPTAPENPAQQG